MNPQRSSTPGVISFVVCSLLCAGTAMAQQSQSPDVGRIRVSGNINTEVTGVPLNEQVNTPYMELGPMPTKDGKRLYFSRQGYPGNTGGANDEDIWYCEFDEATQTWTEAINPGPPLNNQGPNFITGVGLTGDTLLLANEYRKKGKMRAGVSVSVRSGDQWSFPVPVSIAGDYNLAGRTSYDLSHDRKTLIIAQEKFDTKGKLDLYVAFRDPQKDYAGTESINMGSVINTAGDETSPWLAYDGVTLYFSSNGHNGYGKMDIFVTRRLDDTWTNWSEPENLGPGINSSFDDFSFNYNPTSRYAYYARGFTSANTDIFKIDMTKLFVSEGDKLPEIGETFTIHRVFEDDQSEVLSQSVKALEEYLAFLNKHKSVILLVTAHSNIHANRSESLLLSNARAKRIVDWMISKGISARRLSYAGVGHDVVVNSIRDSRETDLSTAVEFKVVDYEK